MKQSCQQIKTLNRQQLNYREYSRPPVAVLHLAFFVFASAATEMYPLYPENAPE